MEDINAVQLVGRLVRDCEIVHTGGGYPLGKLAIAVNRSVKKGNGWEDEVSYFDLNLWGKRAESLQLYLLKGTQIAVQGQLVQNRWEQDGQKKSKVIININNIQLLGGKSKEKQDHHPPSFTEAQQQSSDSDDFDDDIPF